jgi:hypothetical protein
VSDRTKFEIVSDPMEKFTLRIEDKINNFLRKIKPLNVISEEIYKQLFVSGSGPGILYGLPKIHKPNFSVNFPFRPIFAAYNTPSFKLAKFLVPILSPFTTNEHTIENSYKFVNKVKGIHNANSFYMASFDVESLFTNIPLAETIDICLNFLFVDGTDSFMNFSRKLFKTLLELAVLNSFFIFNSKLYKQLEGLGMGLPLGPTFANIFMCFHEQNWLKDCPSDFQPALYQRYIDDTFLLFHKESDAQHFLNYLNSKHPNIKFTMEGERENKLSFLDCCIERKCNKFMTSVYRKDTFSGLGTSFFSFCSFNFKVNSIKTLLSRAYKVSSDYISMHNEFEFLRTFFTTNGYPLALVNSHIKKFLSNRFNEEPIVEDPRRSMYVSFPYFGHQSEKLKEELLHLLGKFCPDINFKIILVNKFSIASLFPFKDRLPNGMQSSLVYEFSCARCASTYVGSTIRTLRTRVAEHAGRSHRTGSLLSAPSHSSVRSHAHSCDITVDLTKFRVLGRCKNFSDLRILESLHIFKLKPTLNDQQSALPLNIVGK